MYCEAMRAEIASRSATITFIGVLGLIASWALSVVLPVINELNLDREALQAATQIIRQILPLP